MSARNIPAEARARQEIASDPSASVFVSANAGSGKTHVLVQRVIRLLLDGVPPERILCITFTKAAAANMAERVFAKLGQWVTLDDEALTAAIRATGIKAVGAPLLAQARKLFACALETPGGLKVQTIHALCTRLLQQFPFEANVPARFTVLDDRDQADLMQRASLAVLLQAAAAPDSEAGRALAFAMTSAADVTFREVVQQACMSRDRFLGWIAQAGGVEPAMAQLSATLGVAADDRCEALERDIVDGPNLPRSHWLDAAAALERGSKTDGEQAGRLRAALASSDTAQIDNYLEVFFTKERTLRKTVVTKKLAAAAPGLAENLQREASRLEGLVERRRALMMRERTRALLVIAAEVAARIDREKQERGLLDYDDLIDRTLQMLGSGASGWVHFKLDRGVDHVLIDEAQDTSPKQWDIVAHLIDEFTAGAGARDGVKRTIFAVGDEKQSIFSFQGAVPKEFAERRELLLRRFHGAGLAFEKVAFNYSFRSGAAILQSVDHVFRDPQIYRSIHADDAYPLHQSLADAGPSLIDLWPLEVPDPRPQIEGWRAPFDAVSETSPAVRLAQKVQAEVTALIAAGTLTGPVGDRRPLSYGDVLVLVRRRGAAFDAVIQALKRAGVPVAGADRLKLTEHIAVIDLMHLADALLLPQDDLALAVALKSPLFGLDDDDLFRLAWRRSGSLRAALAEHAPSDPTFAAAQRRLDGYAARARAETPFAFYAGVLGGDGGDSGRARILRRLGPEANDALDEFLELALSYEQKTAPSLQGLIAWLRAADIEIKRDMEIKRDEVRVMTVHGAKGLEAPVVFLIDTTSSPSDSQRLNLIRLPGGNAGPGSVAAMVWGGRKDEDPRVVEQARAAMVAETEDEYRRLLYVAMTRAADRLIVGGCMPGNRNEVRPLSWYDLISKGLENSTLAMQRVPPPDGAVQRYCRPEDAVEDTIAAAAAAADPRAAPPVVPDWLRRCVPQPPPPRGALRPSDADDDHRRLRRGETEESRARALLRGTLVHRLLQSLPALAAPDRAAAALRFLARNAGGWSEDDCAALAAQIIGLIDEPRFAGVFGAGSRAEVPIIGRLQRCGLPVLVSGQIDRLVVTDSEVLIVDYKTNHAPPQRQADAPPAYVRQLAHYRAVLAALYPQRRVRAALLWTETPEIMEISASALDAEQADLTPL